MKLRIIKVYEHGDEAERYWVETKKPRERWRWQGTFDTEQKARDCVAKEFVLIREVVASYQDVRSIHEA